MRVAVVLALCCMSLVCAASVWHAHRKSESVGYWMQRATSCWVGKSHPLPLEAL